MRIVESFSTTTACPKGIYRILFWGAVILAGYRYVENIIPYGRCRMTASSVNTALGNEGSFRVQKNPAVSSC